jgi:hypothetical protein
VENRIAIARDLAGHCRPSQALPARPSIAGQAKIEATENIKIVKRNKSI